MTGWLAVCVFQRSRCVLILHILTSSFVWFVHDKQYRGKKLTFYWSWIVVEWLLRWLPVVVVWSYLKNCSLRSSHTGYERVPRAFRIAITFVLWPFAERMRKETAWARGKVRAVWLSSHCPQGTYQNCVAFQITSRNLSHLKLLCIKCKSRRFPSPDHLQHTEGLQILIHVASFSPVKGLTRLVQLIMHFMSLCRQWVLLFFCFLSFSSEV